MRNNLTLKAYNSLQKKYFVNKINFYHVRNLQINYRRVAKVSIGVFVEPQFLLSAGDALTRGLRGHAPPEIFENLGSKKLHFLHFETHFRQVTTLFYSSFLSYYIISTA